MKTSIKFSALMIAFMIASSFTVFDGASASWKKLGTMKVSYKLDRDVLHVGANDGIFKKLKIKVSGGDLNIHRMVVEYGNGSHDNITIKHNFRKGMNSRIIDLEGGKRIIKDITFWYDTKNNSKRKAKVTVFGGK